MTTREELDHEIAVEGLPANKKGFWAGVKDKIRFATAGSEGEEPETLDSSARQRYTEGITMFEELAKRSSEARYWSAAAKYYHRASQCSELLGAHKRRGDFAYSSGNCYVNNGDRGEGVARWKDALDGYGCGGAYTDAAKVSCDIGAYYKTPGPGFDSLLCVKYYKTAARYYANNYMVQHSNTVLSEMAYALVLEKFYSDAASLYEQCAESCLGSKLLRLSACEYLFLYCLANCAQFTWDGGVDADDAREADIERMSEAVSRGEELDTAFSESRREHEFITNIIAAYRAGCEGGLKAFEAAVTLFAKVNILDGVRLVLVEGVRSNIRRRDGVAGKKGKGFFSSMFKKT